MFDVTNPRYEEQISPVPWHFIKSRFSTVPWAYELCLAWGTNWSEQTKPQNKEKGMSDSLKLSCRDGEHCVIAARLEGLWGRLLSSAKGLRHVLLFWTAVHEHIIYFFCSEWQFAAMKLILLFLFWMALPRHEHINLIFVWFERQFPAINKLVLLLLLFDFYF